MSPSAAALLGGGVTAAYVPFLRGQIRAGEIAIPFGTINPIRVRRAEHPLAFRCCVTALVAAVSILLVVCAILLIRAVAG